MILKVLAVILAVVGILILVGGVEDSDHGMIYSGLFFSLLGAIVIGGSS